MAAMSSISTATDLRIVQQGDGPDVLLIAGLGDPAEAWQAQLDGLQHRYRVTAFDNRGVGRSPLPPDGAPFTVASMAADAAEVLLAAGVERAHVAGFSGGGAIAQELALRHPGRVRSLVLSGTFDHADAYMQRVLRGWRWLPESAPSERAFLEAFLTWIYTPRAHADGWVDGVIEEMLAYPHQQSTEAFQRSIDAFLEHDTRDRLHLIDVPALVISGELDLVCPPRTGEAIADAIPGAVHVLMEGHAHQPFQESPHTWNRIVDGFWSRV
jgi:pimeloyl-ACP methyl ester carboxylesterase